MSIVLVGQGRDRSSIILANAQGVEVGVASIPPKPKTIRAWRCSNCGHEEEQTDSLRELMFRYMGPPRTSKVQCPGCGIYTLQQAFDGTFRSGYFLVVRPKNGIRGKGRC